MTCGECECIPISTLTAVYGGTIMFNIIYVLQYYKTSSGKALLLSSWWAKYCKTNTMYLIYLRFIIYHLL